MCYQNEMTFLRILIPLVFFLLLPSSASAGIPECGNLRLEGVSRCEIRGSVQCEGSCSRLGIYKKACATKLQKVCRKDCTLSANPTCTDSCTVSCKTRCDKGESITCSHNCYGECNGSCGTSCAGKPDVAKCIASCEATCDGECDVKCGPVVDAPCYTHCIECCGGSCGAQANMDCQTTCQDKEFETCEHELEIDCKGSCSVKGAIFCDDQFVISGDQIPACVQAMAAQGISAVDVRGSVSIGTDKPPTANVSGCAATPGNSEGGASMAALFALGIVLIRRKRAR